MHICLFDIDGTLISSGGAGKAALEEALAEIYGIPHAIEKLSLSGRTDRAIIRDMLAIHSIGEEAEHWQQVLAAYLKRLPSCLVRHNGHVLPGIADLLQTLSKRDDVLIG